jgi:hypothetical protein
MPLNGRLGRKFIRVDCRVQKRIAEKRPSKKLKSGVAHEMGIYKRK